MGKRGPKPRFINTTWRPELAYVVGVIASDGNLGKDGSYIDVTSKDKDMLVSVLHILDMLHIKVGVKSTGSRSNTWAYRIQFRSITLHQWLVSIGLTPNKSKVIRRLHIPQDLFFDFFRGVWDGDGTIYCVQDKRWENSYVISIGIASASVDFLVWLQGEVNLRIGSTGYITHAKNVLQLRYARVDSKALFNAMFYQPNVPHLARKFAKAKKIFTIHGL